MQLELGGSQEEYLRLPVGGNLVLNCSVSGASQQNQYIWHKLSSCGGPVESQTGKEIFKKRALKCLDVFKNRGIKYISINRTALIEIFAIFILYGLCVVWCSDLLIEYKQTKTMRRNGVVCL